MKENFNDSEEFEQEFGSNNDPNDSGKNPNDENWERHESEVVDPAEESMYEDERIKPVIPPERNPKKMGR